MQKDPVEGHAFPCPRCGHDRMDPVVERNALSRRAEVYICSQCGMDEAMMDFCKEPPLPFNEWSLSLSFEKGY